MFRIRMAVVVAVLLAAPQVFAQQGGATTQRDAGRAALEERCIHLLAGEVQEGDDLRALRSDCEALVRAGANPGTGSGSIDPGAAVRTSFTQAGSELMGRSRPVGMGMTRQGPVRNTLMTNPVGWFSGLGVNLEYSRPFEGFNKASWAVGGNYARANASNGNVTSFGAGGGLDFYLIGKNNEGLRLGGRVGFSVGNEDVGSTTTFARMQGGGEIGYSFVASNGLSAGLTFGLGGRLAGDEQNTEFETLTGTGEFGPYFKVGAGFSW